MKKLTIYSRRSAVLGALALALLTAGLSGCTKKFTDFNTDPTGIQTKDLTVASVFIPLMQEIMYMTDDTYQVGQNLNADIYCGYSMPPQTFGKAQDNANYVFVDSWNQTAFGPIYTNLIGPIRNKLSTSDVRATSPDFWAIALIVEVEAIDRITDKFGPAPYSKVGSSLVSVAYDSQQSIYQQMFAQLDTAAYDLRQFIAANPNSTRLANYDAIFAGDYTKWLKFANSLRLRLAMHLTKIDPATAQTQVQVALNDTSGGVMTAPSDDAAVLASQANGNDYNQITDSYGDNAMNASIQSIMVGYNDPRLPVYFLFDTDPNYTAQYQGIRIGCDIPPKPFYSGFSKYNYITTFNLSAPEMLMTAAEVWFLRAEAALRGWSAEDVQTDYETGIQTSMTQYGVPSAAAAYITDGASKPIDYTDYKNSANNSPAVSTITIKWDAGAASETKLERIITQKWLAMFPEGQEAWTEFRRTGYPKLFPVVANGSGGTIDTQIQVRRLAYPQSEATVNPEGEKGGIQLLGGPDNGGTRLWWDVNKGNF